MNTAEIYQQYYASCRNGTPGLNHLDHPWVSEMAWARGIFSEVWKALDDDEGLNYFEEKTLLPGYTFSPAGALPNQYHLNRLTPTMLGAARSFLVASGLAEVLKTFFASNIGVCNMRAWRYAHGSVDVGEHCDKITPFFRKVMIFRGRVEHNDGCFEYLQTGAWKKVIGMWPVAIIDTGNIRHRAKAPAPGHIRDCIELTVIPRIEDDLPVINAGYAAGMPMNPFLDWRA